MMPTRAPNFLIVGAQRSGTTWLFENLAAHPHIYIPKKKEINYFSDINTTNYSLGKDWYLKYFRNVENETAIGEITPEYLVDKNASERIYKELGNIKIIISLRNPIDRIISSYGKGLRENGWNFDINYFIENNVDYCVDRSKYFLQVKRYIELFGDNVLVFLYDEINKNPISVIKKICSHLGIEGYYSKSLIEKKFNIGIKKPSQIVKSIRIIRDIGYKNRSIYQIIKRFEKTKIGNYLMIQLLNSSKKIKIKEGLHSELVNYFLKDISFLEKLINIEIQENWKF